MDIVRTPRPKRGKYILIGAGSVVVLAATIALSKLEPAAPSVDRATLWVDTVRRGTMVREVRAPGTLVPEHVRIISALTAGRVEQKYATVGTTVGPTTPLLELSNPDVQLSELEADRQLTAAQAELVSLRTNLETQRLQQQAAVAAADADYQEARRQAEVFQSLDKKGLSSANEVQRAKENAANLATRLKTEQQRLALLESTVGGQLALQQANVERLRNIVKFHKDRVTAMVVTAGESGVLQDMTLELGQWVVPGQPLARVAQPGRLKAVLRVPETQAKDIVIGQPVKVDTRTGDPRTSVISGHVIRADLAVLNGTVTVEVGFDGELPKGARPDLSVDGTIEIERLENVLYVGRPAYGQAESTVGLFKLEPDGTHASRVQVKLGRSSVNTIEIAQGLNAGDKVIISDVSQWDSQQRLRLK